MLSMLPDTLRTARLVLRPPRAADAATIFERYAQDLEVTRYLVWRPHRDLAETEAFIQRCLSLWAKATHRPWVITRTDDDAAIGMLELRLAEYTAEVGYVLARSAWGQGLMTEALGTVVERALAEPSLYRVSAVCDVDSAGVRAGAG